MVLSGQLAEPDDDVEAEHMQAAERILSRAGYKRYEVASYAKPGFSVVTTSRTGPAFLIWVWGAARPA